MQRVSVEECSDMDHAMYCAGVLWSCFYGDPTPCGDVQAFYSHSRPVLSHVSAIEVPAEDTAEIQRRWKFQAFPDCGGRLSFKTRSLRRIDLFSLSAQSREDKGTWCLLQISFFHFFYFFSPFLLEEIVLEDCKRHRLLRQPWEANAESGSRGGGLNQRVHPDYAPTSCAWIRHGKNELRQQHWTSSSSTSFHSASTPIKLFWFIGASP